MATYTSWAQIERAYKAKIREFEPAVQRGVAEHAQILYAKSKELMELEIYANPPDEAGSSYKKVKTVLVSAGAGPASYKGKSFGAWANTRGPIAALKVGKIVHGKNKAGQKTVSLYVLHSASAKEAAANRKRGAQHFRTEGKGKAKWEQTGFLRASETMWVGKHIAHIENTASYALARHDLGLSPGNSEAFVGSSRKSKRIAPWRKRAIAWFEPRRLEHYRRWVWEALSK